MILPSYHREHEKITDVNQFKLIFWTKGKLYGQLCQVSSDFRTQFAKIDADTIGTTTGKFLETFQANQTYLVFSVKYLKLGALFDFL